MFTGVRSLRKIGGNERIPASLAEKIMLAVTAVNQCEYCSFLHTQTALEAGVTREEIAEILVGTFGSTDDEEAAALLFAQHWADTRGNPSEAARGKLEEVCGLAKARQVEAYIRIVHMGNMCSNTVVFFDDGAVPREEKAGLLPTYLLCKPIAASIRGRGAKRAAEKRG
jgi:AhpD family alkylhydroperoxidase